MEQSLMIMSASLIIGVIIGLFILKYANKNNVIKTKYDERQDIIRGKAYKYAFYTLLILLVIERVLVECDVFLPFNGSACAVIMAAIAILVQVSYSIWNDSYFGTNNDTKKYVGVFTGITVVNILAAIANAADGMMIQNGQLTGRIVNAVCALLFIIIGIEYLIKNAVKPDESEDSDDEES